MIHKFSEHRAIVSEFLREDSELAERDIQRLLRIRADAWTARVDRLLEASGVPRSERFGVAR